MKIVILTKEEVRTLNSALQAAQQFAARRMVGDGVEQESRDFWKAEMKKFAEFWLKRSHWLEQL